MSGLEFCIGDVNSTNCASVCMQKSDCASDGVCCQPNMGGSFCVDTNGQFSDPATCKQEMGSATTCQDIPDHGTLIKWNSAQLSANMAIASNDAQYTNYMSEFCNQ